MASNDGLFKIIIGLIFKLINLIVRALLWPLYGSSGEKVPPIDNLLLLDSATTLAHKIRTKKVTSYEVVQSFINRIKEVNPILNCVIDERFDDALREAKEVDKFIASGTKTKEELLKDTPFLGVPFTTKDCIGVKGLSCTIGLYSRKGVKADEDADPIALMRKAGAIPIGITNVSELCIWWESNNAVYGRTNNVYNTNHIVGGSSGGEGCLQSCAGSAMGIGSDIGGSVRIPAFFNGIFGHKPSTGIGSLKGHFPPLSSPDQNSYLVVGPMSRYATDLLPMFKVIAANHVNELKLNESVDITKLKYYYMDDDTGGFLISPVDKEIKQAIQKIISYYKKTHGITIEKVNLTKLRYSMALWFAKMKVSDEAQMPSELANRQGEVDIIKELLKFPFMVSHHTLPVLCTAVLEKLNVEYNSPKHRYLLDMCAQLKMEFQVWKKNCFCLWSGYFPQVAQKSHPPAKITPFFELLPNLFNF